MFHSFPDGHLAGDGLVLFGSPARGGQVAMGFWVEPPVLNSASNTERNRFQDQVRQLLRFLPKGYRMQVLWWADSEYHAALTRFADRTEDSANSTARRLRNLNFLWNWERMQQRQIRRERVAIFIGRAFEPKRRTPVRATVAEFFYSEQTEQARTEMRELGKQIAVLFAVQGGRVTTMTEPDLARVFSRKLNPSQSDRPEFDPTSLFDPNRSLLDNFWNCEVRGQGRAGFYLDGYHHGVLVVKRMPSQTIPGIMQRLTQLPFGDYDLTVQVERLDADKLIASEQRELDRINTQLSRKADERLSVTAAKKEERIRRLSEASIAALSIEFIIVVRAKTSEQLAERMLAIKSAVNGLNSAQYLECSLPSTARNMFTKTLPGWMWSRHKGLCLYGEDTFVADLLPLSSTFTGHLDGAEAIYCGNQNNLVGVRLFLGDGEYAAPQNTILIGGTGCGKSVLAGNLLLQTSPFFGFTVIVEEGLSHREFSRSFGIEPILIRPDGNQTLNVFDARGLPMSAYQRGTITALIARMVGLPADENKARQRQALIAKAVAQLCQDHAADKLSQKLEADRVGLLREALCVHRWGKEKGLSQLEAFVEFRTWREEHATEATAQLLKFTTEELHEFEATQWQDVMDFVFSRFAPEEHLTLSSLREFLELNDDEAEECRWIATLLTPWCRGGNYGVLFDGPSNVSLTGRVVHFELGLIPESAKELKALVGFALMNDVRQHLLSLPREMRKQFVVEEVARFLDVPGGERILRELFQSFRKHNAVVIAIMQQYAQIADSPIRAALVGNARAFLIFNPGDRQDIERLAHDIGLSAVAVETVLRYPRPDQQTGARYSECLYFHTDAVHPICGTLRHIRLPDDGYKA